MYDLPYEDVTGSGAIQDHVYRRSIEHTRTLYRQNDLTGPLPLGQAESLALPFMAYKQASTPGLTRQTDVDSGKVTMDGFDGIMGIGGGAGYIHSEGDANWWIPSGLLFFSPGTTDNATAELAYARAHFFLHLRFRDPFYTDLNNTEFVVTYDAYDLLIEETRSPLGNRVTVGERNLDPTRPLVSRGHDYRVPQAALVMDPNRNRSLITFDALGSVAGSAIMGKPEEIRGDSLIDFNPVLSSDVVTTYFSNPLAQAKTLLMHATTRVVYDLFAYYNTRESAEPQPVVVGTLTRETHESDLATGQETTIQNSFTYSDGFGREIQMKVEAEPGPVPMRDPTTGHISVVNIQPQMTIGAVDPRWVGTGWTIFNNKGSPVRKYEPFFTDTHHFEFDLKIGVSPVIFYDPLERPVGALNPDHSWSKVVRNTWNRETWDTNDTVLIVDPKTDADVQDFFRRLADTDYLPSWYTQRHSGALGPQEQDAARKAAVHSGTPEIAHFDSLGRTVLNVSHNKYQHNGGGSPVVEEFYLTRAVIDIEGNRWEIVDANGRAIVRFDYDMLGAVIHQASMEASERWMLNDVVGHLLYRWDSREKQTRTTYDLQRRPIESYLLNGTGPEILVERTEFGETIAYPESHNLRGQASRVFDQGGVATNVDFDFKGNLLSSQRQFAQEYKLILDWSTDISLEAHTYSASTAYDAINRPTVLTSPDGSITHPAYNRARLLERVDVDLKGSGTTTSFITNIDYDVKARRTNIEYGNGVQTTYEYDPLTFRLVHMLTRRNAVTFPGDCPGPSLPSWAGCQIQNLSYTYDPSGNLTYIRDDAQQTIFFR